MGALIALGKIDDGGIYTILSFISVLIASINVFGGFTVTQRMLSMYKSKDRK